ncbi:FAD-dependent oxidoreductase [Spongiibacter sp. KMU-166]|uniref:FAD-dependent oxidoreductase n=1 Tax=Spongiibacter thalassae TaxID=2721624 RepID=A0ABX1GIB8_9GAMM|nr:FAD-dependent oxidoreductase [Spongiibacter thalassae]NKI18690.1 FAD-dependent oxidoreductase [Spongiibacter thalassae]
MSLQDAQYDEFHDVIVVGSGAAGLAAAITAKLNGLNVLVVEKADHYGGTSAVSGGACWIPDNPHMRAAGLEDSLEAAYGYIEILAGEHFKPDLVKTFLEKGSEMVTFLEENTEARFEHRDHSPDYQSDKPGAAMAGRTLDVSLYDGRNLGEHFSALRPPLSDITIFRGLMVNHKDIAHLVNVSKSFKSFCYVTRLITGHIISLLKYGRGTRLLFGQALIARLAKTMFDLNIPLRLETGVTELIEEEGVVTGVVAEHKGQMLRLGAKKGVVLAAGGFPQSAEKKFKFMSHVRNGAEHFTLARSSSDGLTQDAAVKVGAKPMAVGASPAFYMPVTLVTQADGTTVPHTNLMDRAKPGVIAVNTDGKRFTNEAASYHDFGASMVAAGLKYAWLVCDEKALRQFGLGAVRPAPIPYKKYLRSGYLKTGATIEDLASEIGVPKNELRDTIERFNVDAAQGVDSEFGKGSTAYQEMMGDPEHKPNACVRPLEGPFFAVKLQHGDIGTACGLATNVHAQVLSTSGEPIRGLYACGNEMDSITGGVYPGGGTTLGPGLTFGYIAGQHVAKSS